MGEAIELLETMAVKLGVAVEHLWSILVKQQIADGVTDIILAVFFVTVVILTLIFAPKFAKRADDEYKRLKEDRQNNGTGFKHSYKIPSFEEDHYENLKDNIPGVAIFIGLLSLVLALVFATCGIKELINPEYFALKEIMNAISNG